MQREDVQQRVWKNSNSGSASILLRDQGGKEETDGCLSLPSGLSVNGHLMGAPSRPGHEERPRTYLDVITIAVEHPHASYVINITQKGVTLYGEEVLVLPLTQRATISKPPLAISMWPEANITVQIGSTVEFLVLLHHYSQPTVLQLDHLGFYIVKSQGLSASAGGLLGKLFFQEGDYHGF